MKKLLRIPYYYGRTGSPTAMNLRARISDFFRISGFGLRISGCAGLLLLCVGAPTALAQAKTPLQIEQQKTPYNLQSETGVPISTIPDTATVRHGSNGKMPTVNSSTGNAEMPTPGQFRSLVSFGSVVRTTNQSVDVLTTNYPKGGGFVFRRVQIGAPFLMRPTTLMFGQVIPPPEVDINGVKLDSLPSPIAPTDYWRLKPSFDAGKTAEQLRFYWSPHAEKAYAF
jgi:hypothetical protein